MNGQRGVEQADSVTFSRDVKLIELPEKLGGSSSRKPALALRSLLENGFQNFKGRMGSVFSLVEDQHAIFHATGSEEANILTPREFLRRSFGRFTNGHTASRRCNNVEMVRNQCFIGENQEEAKLLQNSNFGNTSNCVD